jgi:hypothetical protein
MAKATVEKVQASAEALQREHRRELHQLLGLLRSELTELSKSHGEQAKSIAGFAKVAAHEATRTQPNPHLLELAIEGLEESGEEFEASHPRLVQIVGTLSTLVANMAI